MAYGIGAIVRNTAGGITASFGLVFLLPQLAKALPGSWYGDLERWLPGGDIVPAITSSQSQLLNPDMFPAWGEFAVFAGYAVIMLGLGALLFSRRDA
jgi:ABC-2 type transport system permease protein